MQKTAQKKKEIHGNEKKLTIEVMMKPNNWKKTIWGNKKQIEET